MRKPYHSMMPNCRASHSYHYSPEAWCVGGGEHCGKLNTWLKGDPHVRSL